MSARRNATERTARRRAAKKGARSRFLARVLAGDGHVRMESEHPTHAAAVRQVANGARQCFDVFGYAETEVVKVTPKGMRTRTHKGHIHRGTAGEPGQIQSHAQLRARIAASPATALPHGYIGRDVQEPL